MLFLLRSESIMPLVMRVPASSKRTFQRYITRLVGRILPISGVVTRITLEKKTSRTGQPYAAFCFEAMEELSPDEADNSRRFAREFMIYDGFDLWKNKRWKF